MGTALAWFRDGVKWRLTFARQYFFLLATFWNGLQLIAAYRRRLPCARAVPWSRYTLRHPADRSGLVETILEIWLDGVYTADFYAPIDGDVVIDAGANVGLFSVWLARAKPHCRIVAFEPAPENFKFLTSNIKSASLTNVEAHCGALAERSGYASINTDAARSLDYRVSVGGTGQLIRAYSLADALAIAGSERIALFKIDIEGSEYGLFTSATDADLARVSRFAIEYHNHLRPGTCAFVAERLRATHRVTIRPSPNAEYGMLYAVRQQAA